MNKNIRFAPFALVALGACNASPEEIRRENEKTRAQNLEMKASITGYNIRVWTDPDTKREYVIVNGNGVAITPRLPKE